MTTKHSVSESNHSPLPARGVGGEAFRGGAGGEAIITPADIAPYIPQALKEMQRAVAVAKQEATKNHRQVPRIYTTISAIDLAPMDYANEYMLIRQKKSNLSAETREAVLTVGNLALQLLISDTVGHVESKEELRRSSKQALIAIVTFLAVLTAIWWVLVKYL